MADAPIVEPITVCPQLKAMALAHRSLAGGITKLVVDVPTPPGVVTAIGPVVVPAATVAVICVAELTTKLLAAVPLKAIAVAPVNDVPVITTTVPADPEPGVKEVTTGGCTTVKLVEEVPVLMGVVTAMGPVVAPAGTVTVI